MTATAGPNERVPDRIDPALEAAERFHDLMALSSFGADAVRQDELCGSRLLGKFDPIEDGNAAEGSDFAARLHDELGQRFEEKGMAEDAELNYRAALRVSPQDRPGVAVRLAILLEKGGDRDGALDWYVFAVASSQTVNDATHHLATICHDVGDEQVADILLALGRSRMNSGLTRLKRYQQARPPRRIKIAHTDSDAESLYFAACHFHVGGEYESAYVCYREAFVRQHRMAVFGLRSLSWLSDRRAKAQGPWKSAKEELESSAAVWANEQKRRLVERACREPLVQTIDAPEPGDDLERLISRAVRGDRRSLNHVLAVIRPLVVRYCRARLGRAQQSYASADDIAQEVLLAVLTALPHYDENGRPFLAFVYGIAAHKVADAHRAFARMRAEPVSEVPDRQDLRDGPEQRALNRALAEQMGRLLDTLPTKQREIILLRVVVGLSAEETAEAIEATPGAVRVAQHRALSKLRKSLSKASEDVARPEEAS